MKEITIYKFQLEAIIEALRITSNIHESSKGTTCHDRQVRQAYEYAKNALAGKKDVEVNYMRGPQDEIPPLNRLIKVPIGETEYHLHFFCPACKTRHAIDNTWEFNGDYDFPTLNPSIRTHGSKKNEQGEYEPFVCHSWITRGKIKFFGDCSHNLAGQQWFELPEINENTPV